MAAGGSRVSVGQTEQRVPWSSGSEPPKLKAPPNACDCHMHTYDSRFPVAPNAKLRPADATPDDYRLFQKRIGGSVGIPLNHLGERLSELPADRPLLVYCAGGYRSSIGASLLQCHGFTKVSEIAGGIAAWDAGTLPLEM